MAIVRIRVPKTPRDAYNPDRPAGTLLRHQLAHLEWAVRPAGERHDLTPPPNPTESEVAERIQHLMADLHGKTIGREPLIAPRRRPKPTRRSTTGKSRRRARR